MTKYSREYALHLIHDIVNHQHKFTDQDLQCIITHGLVPQLAQQCDDQDIVLRITNMDQHYWDWLNKSNVEIVESVQKLNKED